MKKETNWIIEKLRDLEIEDDRVGKTFLYKKYNEEYICEIATLWQGRKGLSLWSKESKGSCISFSGTDEEFYESFELV